MERETWSVKREAAKGVEADLAAPLINTPLQRDERGRSKNLNRFSGFRPGTQSYGSRKTAEAVQISSARSTTLLKRGVNEKTIACP